MLNSKVRLLLESQQGARKIEIDSLDDKCNYHAKMITEYSNRKEALRLEYNKIQELLVE